LKIPHIASRTDGQGISVFIQDDGRVFHTYSAYRVGADVMLSAYRRVVGGLRSWLSDFGDY
jgi:predicted dithiol-disulfide oxidoreductase (DUF899 family)